MRASQPDGPANAHSATRRPQFQLIAGLSLSAAFDAGRLSSDGGLVWLAEADQSVGICEALAACIPEWRRGPVLHSLPTLVRQLRLIARNARQIYDQAGLLLELLRSAARADPEVQAVVSKLEEERHRRGRLSARALVDKGALRRGLSAAEAARTLWVLTVPELYLRQVRELGLTADTYERWLASLLQHALLPD